MTEHTNLRIWLQCESCGSYAQPLDAEFNFEWESNLSTYIVKIVMTCSFCGVKNTLKFRTWKDDSK